MIARAALRAVMCGGTFVAVTTAACHRRHADSATGSESPSPVAGESILHGTVSLTGTGFEQTLKLVTSAGSRLLRASPADSAALVRLAGGPLEVSVHTVDDGNALRVMRFTVVSVQGKPVADGVVRATGDRMFLETDRGAVSLGNPPRSLRQLVGARVWIGGDLDHGPNTYGVIVPP